MTRAIDRTYEAIRAAILERRFAVGSQLTEQDLALELGVSRTPVREALRRLGAEGLVEFTSSQRASVASWEQGDIGAMFSMRALIEGFVCAAAAQRITAEELARLHALASKIEAEAAARTEGFLERISGHNNAFHKLILEASGSDRFARILASIVDLPIVLRTFHLYTDEELRRSCRHHREIIDSFIAHDPDWARSVMEAHIYAARASFVRDMDEKT